MATKTSGSEATKKGFHRLIPQFTGKHVDPGRTAAQERKREVDKFLSAVIFASYGQDEHQVVARAQERIQGPAEISWTRLMQRLDRDELSALHRQLPVFIMYFMATFDPDCTWGPWLQEGQADGDTRGDLETTQPEQDGCRQRSESLPVNLSPLDELGARFHLPDWLSPHLDEYMAATRLRIAYAIGCRYARAKDVTPTRPNRQGVPNSGDGVDTRPPLTPNGPDTGYNSMPDLTDSDSGQERQGDTGSQDFEVALRSLSIRSQRRRRQRKRRQEQRQNQRTMATTNTDGKSTIGHTRVNGRSDTEPKLDEFPEALNF